MKSMARTTHNGDKTYPSLAFVCPGCATDGHGTGLHLLPVNTDQTSPAWTWDGNLEAPTISPSILTRWGAGADNLPPPFVCHSFLRAGVFEFLSDCTHALAGTLVPMPDLPDWFTHEDETKEG